jgi:hypothetical protein
MWLNESQNPLETCDVIIEGAVGGGHDGYGLSGVQLNRSGNIDIFIDLGVPFLPSLFDSDN